MEGYSGEETELFLENTQFLSTFYLETVPRIFKKDARGTYKKVHERYPWLNGRESEASYLESDEDITLCGLVNQALQRATWFSREYEADLINPELHNDVDTAFTCTNLLESLRSVLLKREQTAKAFSKAADALIALKAKLGSTEIPFLLLEYECYDGEERQERKRAFLDMRKGYTESKKVYLKFRDEFIQHSVQLAQEESVSKFSYLNHLVYDKIQKIDGKTIEAFINDQDKLFNAATKKFVNMNVDAEVAEATPVMANPDSQDGGTRDQAAAKATWWLKENLLRSQMKKADTLLDSLSEEGVKDWKTNISKRSMELESDFVQLPMAVRPDLNELPDITEIFEKLNSRLESLRSARHIEEEDRKLERSEAIKTLPHVKMPVLDGQSSYLNWRQGQMKLNTHKDGYKKAQALKSTIVDPLVKARITALNDYQAIMEVISDMYASESQLVPALLRELRNLDPAPNMSQFQRVATKIRNCFQNIFALGETAMSFIDATIIEELILKLPPTLQVKWDNYILEKEAQGIYSEEEDEKFTSSGGDLPAVSVLHDMTPLQITTESKNLRTRFIRFLKFHEKSVNKTLNRQRLAGVPQTLGENTPPPNNRRRNEETKKEERKKKKKVGYKTQSYSATSTQPICVACDTQTPHLSKEKKQPTKSLVACPVFRGLPTNKARRAIITEHKFCQKCLSPTCPLPGCYKDTCKNGCSDSHHYMICSKKDYVQPSAVSVESHCGSTQKGVRLMVGRAKVKLGRRQADTTLFFDSGSSTNFVRSAFVKKHNLKGSPATLRISKLDTDYETLTTYRYDVDIVSHEGEVYTITCHEVDKLTSVKLMTPNTLKSLSREFKVPVSDINNASGMADILIGASSLSLHPKLLRVNPKSGVGLYHSLLGKPYWVCGGRQEGEEHSVNFVDASRRDFFSSWIQSDQVGLNEEPRCHVCLSAPKCKACKNMESPASYKDQEESKLIKSHTHCDFENHKVTVTFPWLEDPYKVFSPQNSNKAIVEKMAKNLMNSLKKDNKLEAYTDVFAEAVERGVYQEISDEEVDAWDRSQNPSNYVSHHLVVSEKTDSTTPLRIVVNSSTPHHGMTLNECLPRGASTISNILHVLLRLREHPYLLLMDISKAYHALRTPGGIEKHCRRLLWLRKEDLPEESKKEHPKWRHYVATSACFGDRPSGQFLEFCKERIAQWCGENGDELTKLTILLNSYVDDIIKSLRTEKEGRYLMTSIPEAFSTLGFSLKPPVLIGPGIPVDPEFAAKDNSVLGYKYDPLKDTLQVRHKVNFSVKRRSARIHPDLKSVEELEDRDLTLNDLASLIASQFDPLGLQSAFSAKGKLIFSRIVKSGVKWKDVLSPEDQQCVKKYAAEILSLVENPVDFPRAPPPGFELVQLVVMCDASSVALHCVLYGIFENEEGDKISRLLNGKHRIVSHSVPANELWAIYASLRLIHGYIHACSPPKLESISILSDSNCSLDMMKKEYIPKDVFAKNKVNGCHRYHSSLRVPLRYYHIASELNRPADMGTREECTPEYIRSENWQYGPEFIKCLDESQEANLSSTVPPNTGTDDPYPLDVEVNAAAAEEVPAPEDPLTCLMERQSSLQRVLRTLCLVRRFVKKITSKTLKAERTKPGPLPDWKKFPPFSFTIQEMVGSFLTLVRVSQKNHPVDSLRIKQLLSYTDPETGIVFTRQRCTSETMENVFGTSKLPILSPASRLAGLLLAHAHLLEIANSSQRAHAGLHQTIVNTRCGPYGAFIVNVKQKAKGFIWRCVSCKKARKIPQDAQIGQRKALGLPPPPDGAAFTSVILDYFGPIRTARPKQGMGTRNVPGTYKTWGCVFYDQTTHAVNLEMVEGYDKDSFHRAFRTHCAKFTVPSQITSDPMGAFVAAAKECDEEIDIDEYTNLFSSLNIRWKLCPPQSQFRTGAAESIVKAVKLITRYLGNHEIPPALTPGEINLLFANISEILNRRPIASRVDGDRVEILCPNQLLMGRPSKQNVGIGDSNLDPFCRAKLIRDLTAQFWKGLQRELAESPHLFKANKWQNTGRMPRVGDIVLILYSSKISDSYRIAKITNVIDERTIETLVSPPQDGNKVKISSFKSCKPMTVAIQRTVLLHGKDND